MPRALTQEERDRRDAASLARFEARLAQTGTPGVKTTKDTTAIKTKDQLIEHIQKATTTAEMEEAVKNYASHRRGPKAQEKVFSMDGILAPVLKMILLTGLVVKPESTRSRPRPPKANPQKRGRKPWWWSEADTPEAQETMMQWV